MCGRAACSLAPDVVYQAVNATGQWRDKERYFPSYNCSSGSFLPALVGVRERGAGGSAKRMKRVLRSMKWGIRCKTEEKSSIINGRSETLKDKPLFKKLLPNQRCVVCCEGYYEWVPSTTGQQQRKQPYFFHLPNQNLIMLAGLFDVLPPSSSSSSISSSSSSSITSSSDSLSSQSQGSGQSESECFIVVTVPALKRHHWVHTRMPAVLTTPEAVDMWLDPATPVDTALALLKPCDTIECYPVSRSVNTIKYNAPNCIQKIEPPDENSVVVHINSPDRPTDAARRGKAEVAAAAALSSGTNHSGPSSASLDSSSSSSVSHHTSGDTFDEDEFWLSAIPLIDDSIKEYEEVSASNSSSPLGSSSSSSSSSSSLSSSSSVSSSSSSPSDSILHNNKRKHEDTDDNHNKNAEILMPKKCAYNRPLIL